MTVEALEQNIPDSQRVFTWKSITDSFMMSQNCLCTAVYKLYYSKNISERNAKISTN